MRTSIVSLAIFAFALAYSVVTGPFRGADEPGHFFRAYQISEGQLLARRAPNGMLGGDLPSSLRAIARAAGEFPKVPKISTSSAQLRVAGRIRLHPRTRSLTIFPRSALSSPALYLPQAAAIAFVRLVEHRPLVLFYAARFFGALCGATLLVLAVRRLPPAAEALGVFALIPMVLFQAGVIGADTIGLPLAFLWSAEILHARSGEKFSPATHLRLVLVALAVSQLSTPLLALGILAIPLSGFSGKGRGRAFLAMLAATIILPWLLWLTNVLPLLSQIRPGPKTDPWQQVVLLLHEPQHFFGALAGDLREHGLHHLREMLGVFGWLNFPLPWPLIVPVAAVLAAAVCLVRPGELRITPAVRTLFLTSVLLGFLAAAFAVYAIWNAPGSVRLQGFGGRLLLPMLPFVLIAISNDRLRRVPRLTEIIFAGSIFANLLALGWLAHATFS